MMASDLSKLIEDTLCSTLNGLLAKEVHLKQTNKAIQQDFINIETLKVDSTFEFDNITSTWSFIIPAFTASHIFNSMIGEDSEPVLQIDSDISDAINEFISNVSGGLTTVINGSGFEDLGTSKFTIVEKEVIPENTLDTFENIFKFTIDLDGTEIIIFILFDKVILPFLDKISQSKESVYNELAEDEIENLDLENIEIENLEAESDNESEKIASQTQDKALNNISSEEDNIDKTISNTDDNKEDKKDENKDIIEKQENLTEEEKKANKLKKIIIIISALLITTILIGIILYFMGMFEPEPIPETKDENTTKIIKTKDNVEIVQYDTPNKINFNSSQINENRLNAKLEILTKYEILNKEQVEAQILAEKERLYQLEKEKELLEFAAKNTEEDIFTKKENEQNILQKKETKISQDNNSKLKFVLVHSLKYKLYKELILKTNSKKGRISICKNQDGRTAVYIGPFEEIATQNQMVQLLREQRDIDVSKENLTQEEFDTRCNFE